MAAFVKNDCLSFESNMMAVGVDNSRAESEALRVGREFGLLSV